ncbi:tRNA 2'-phosphotransferase 1-like isoform X1 [Phalaenopsis equestris]|uniref:tRNA 2'-phosphotransferase 1-like isoform X1 n=1 Tax=Phalaenopsis equestris TaxID=78828 RepID=UPI0009E41947|nr:tRNA 2'-phosphotransferase 1-like isoform X1 [Phalaenopsis equestris]
MRASIGSALRLFRLSSLHRVPPSSSFFKFFCPVSAPHPILLLCMDKGNPADSHHSKPFSSSATSSKRSGRGRGRDFSKGDSVGGEDHRIDALGRLMTRILRHMAAEVNLEMRSDGFVRVGDLLKLNLTTYAKVPLRAHTIEDVKEAVRRDNKQRFSLLEENGELVVRANQGHSIKTVTSESLLKPILSANELQVCVHGTYKKNLESILQYGLKRMERLHVHFASGLPSDGEVISGMRRDVNMLIFLDLRKALQDGMRFYISDNKVILTEGFDGIVPAKYFEKMITWPGRHNIPFGQI